MGPVWEQGEELREEVLFVCLAGLMALSVLGPEDSNIVSWREGERGGQIEALGETQNHGWIRSQGQSERDGMSLTLALENSTFPQSKIRKTGDGGEQSAV